MPGFFALAAWALLAGAPPAATQEAVSDSLRLDGQLHVDGNPADTGTVTLHRVSAEDAGPVDSVRVDGQGRFAFTLPGPPSGGTEGERPEGAPPEDPIEGEDVSDALTPGDIYFASARYEGILYHGPPLADPEELEAPYVIGAYSTVEASPGGEPLPVALRQLLLEEVDGYWEVTDVFEVENREERTFVGGGDEGVVWRHALPEGADRFQVGEGEIPAGEAVEVDGEVRVASPFTPGSRLLVIRYVLPHLERGFPVAPGTDSVEVFVREPAGGLELANLERAAPVEVEPGVSFRRYAGPGSGADVLEFQEPGQELGAEHLVVVLTLLLTGAGMWVLLGSGREGRPATAGAAVSEEGGTGSAATEAVTDPSAIMERIAALDEAHARGEGPPEEEYHARRQELVARLAGQE